LSSEGASNLRSHRGGDDRRYSRGEIQLFHELIRPYERSVYVMALSYPKNETDAEDVAQDAFIRAFRKLSSFRAESKFSTWLISITPQRGENPSTQVGSGPDGTPRATAG